MSKLFPSKKELRNEQRRKDEEEWDAGDRARREEAFRKSELSMYMRIEEATSIEDIKEILHLITEE